LLFSLVLIGCLKIAWVNTERLVDFVTRFLEIWRIARLVAYETFDVELARDELGSSKSIHSRQSAVRPTYFCPDLRLHFHRPLMLDLGLDDA